MVGRGKVRLFRLCVGERLGCHSFPYSSFAAETYVLKTSSAI